MSKDNFTKREVFATEELLDHEVFADEGNKIQFMDCVVIKKSGRFILKKDITDDIKKIIEKWNS